MNYIFSRQTSSLKVHTVVALPPMTQREQCTSAFGYHSGKLSVPVETLSEMVVRLDAVTIPGLI
jgi:hypothetical protein